MQKAYKFWQGIVQTRAKSSQRSAIAKPSGKAPTVDVFLYLLAVATLCLYILAILGSPRVFGRRSYDSSNFPVRFVLDLKNDSAPNPAIRHP